VGPTATLNHEERQELLRQGKIVQRVAEELSKLLNERSREKDLQAMDKMRELVVSLYREGTAYTNLVIVAGYAGAFAIWHFMGSSISVKARFWSALLILLSILCFAAFEVQKMIREGWRLQGLSEAMLTLPESQRLEALQALLVKGQLIQGKIWIIFLIPTVLTALAAAVFLASAFVAKLFGYQFLP
jgi:hypothetical protein